MIKTTGVCETNLVVVNQLRITTRFVVNSVRSDTGLTTLYRSKTVGRTYLNNKILKSYIYFKSKTVRGP